MKKFKIEINRKTYSMIDVKQWAEDLEVKPKEILEKIKNWDAKQWAIFAYTQFDSDYIGDITDLGDDIGTDDVDFYGEELSVLTDDEAEDRWEEELDSYIDEALEIPDYIRPYFDEEAWKREARLDGRGHAISRYDGHENDFHIKFDDGSEEWIYIYRQN